MTIRKNNFKEKTTRKEQWNESSVRLGHKHNRWIENNIAQESFKREFLNDGPFFTLFLNAGPSIIICLQDSMGITFRKLFTGAWMIIVWFPF